MDCGRLRQTFCLFAKTVLLPLFVHLQTIPNIQIVESEIMQCDFNLGKS